VTANLPPSWSVVTNYLVT